MIRPDTLAFVQRVVDPELAALRAERDRLAAQLAARIWDAERLAQETEQALLDVSRMARYLLNAERVGRAIGAQAARRLTVAARFTDLTRGGA